MKPRRIAISLEVETAKPLRKLVDRLWWLRRTGFTVVEQVQANVIKEKRHASR